MQIAASRATSRRSIENPVAGTGSAKLINDVPEELEIYADAHLLRRMIQNLIANAITLTPGTMTVDARGRPAVLFVHVMSFSDIESTLEEMADLERRNPYRSPSGCGCDLTGMAPPAVHIVDNHEGGAS